jgi:hypothetical protein
MDTNLHLRSSRIQQDIEPLRSKDIHVFKMTSLEYGQALVVLLKLAILYFYGKSATEALNAKCT